VQTLDVNGKPATGFIVMAIIVVKGKVLYLYHGSDLVGPETITRLLKTSQATVAATLAQN
jgi:hypothetical protein